VNAKVSQAKAGKFPEILGWRGFEPLDCARFTKFSQA
jgi:hypothetical protein